MNVRMNNNNNNNSLKKKLKKYKWKEERKFLSKRAMNVVKRKTGNNITFEEKDLTNRKSFPFDSFLKHRISQMLNV